MNRKQKITITVVSIILAAVLVGFIYDAVLTSVEKKTHPRTYILNVEAASNEYGVPAYIIFAVIKTESDFDPEAVSSASAYGLMQLTSETYTDMSGLPFSEAAVFDPGTNINNGTRYLAWLYERYGNWETVYAAYNAGPGNVDSWLADRNYSSDGKTLDDIPFTETRNYVRKVKEAADVYIRLYYS